MLKKIPNGFGGVPASDVFGAMDAGDGFSAWALSSPGVTGGITQPGSQSTGAALSLTALLCGFAACVAARNGDKVKADGVNDYSVHVESAGAAAGTFTAGAVTAPSYAINALLAPGDPKWGSTT